MKRAFHRPLYLDYNATTPIAPEVLEAMRPHLEEHHGNPSSAHRYGRIAREAVERARDEVAALIGATPDEIVFTSGGTEANNAVLHQAVPRAGQGSAQVVTSVVEHPSVLEPCARLRAEGHEVILAPVDGEGTVRIDAISAALTSATSLVSIMYAQNEVGTLQPVAEIAREARACGALFHTDAAQAIGKVRVSVRELPADFLTIAGHKLYAPKGVGALFVRRGVRFEPYLRGAGHEGGRRAGTENVASIVGLGAACALAGGRFAAEGVRLAALRDALWRGLSARVDDIHQHAPSAPRLPNTLSVGFGGTAAADLLARLEEDVAVSAGAACHGDGSASSGVLAAMGVPMHVARGTLRFSLGAGSTRKEIDAAVAAVAAAVEAARRSAPLAG